MYKYGEGDSIFADWLVEESTAITKVKNYSDCILYNKGGYEKGILDFVMHATYLDKNNEGYKDLVSDIKRQKVCASLSKILESDNCILCVNNNPMPKAFKFFVAKDIKGADKNKLKLFIDVTGLIDISNKNYSYRMSDLNIIISFLLAGMNAMIYYMRPEKVINNRELTEMGATIFSSFIFYIVDYLRLTADNTTRGKIKYLASKYYQISILGKDAESEAVENLALKISKISSNEASVVEVKVSEVKNPYANLNSFVKALSVFLNSPKFTLDVLVDKWMYSLGSGSQFGLELYPAFAGIVIYAYVGAYINNQRTIEKIVGREMVSFVTHIMHIGAELI